MYISVLKTLSFWGTDKTLPAYHLPEMCRGNDLQALAVRSNISQTGFPDSCAWEWKRHQTEEGKELWPVR